ncbi:MAG: hypothetical protein ABIF22_00570 [bacterium]
MNTNDLFEFNKDCIIRKEKVGYIVYVSGKLAYLTSKGFNFISFIKQFENFSISMLSKKTGYDEKELKLVVQKLFLSGTIRRKEVK